MRGLCTRTRLVSPDLRLALRRRVHDDREQVLARRRTLDVERRERADVMRDLLAVDEHRRLVVDALELDASRPCTRAR